QADIANAGANIGELPGPAAILVISAGRKLPSYRRRVFDTSLRLAVALQEIAGCEGGLAHNLCDDLVAEQARLELAAEMRGVFVDIGFSFLDAVQGGLFLKLERLRARHAHVTLDALRHRHF